MEKDSKSRQAKNLFQRLVKHRTEVGREAMIVWKHVSNLSHYMPIQNSTITSSDSRSELSPKSYNRIIDYLQIFSEAVFPIRRASISQGTLVCHPDHPAEEKIQTKWFFINGFATSPPVALLNGKELARLFQRPIHLIHTPTHGALFDVFRSFHARTLRKDGSLSRPAYPVIRKALLENDRVIIIGHSEGTIVNSYVVRKLLKDPLMQKHLEKLEVYCLAGVADNFRVDKELSETAGHPVPYVEHFANEGDLAAQLGILAHRDKIEGVLFKLEQRGHLLNEHYLSHLEKGDYCNAQSRLFKYLHGAQPSNQDYLSTESVIT